MFTFEFEFGGLAQLARAFGWQPKGHRFDSDILHKTILFRMVFLFLLEQLESMTIRQASQKDLQGAKALTETCALAMQSKGIFQWNEHYPSLKKLQLDIDRQELYVFEENDKILGIIVLSEIMDEEYMPVSWLTPSEKIYISTVWQHFPLTGVRDMGKN